MYGSAKPEATRPKVTVKTLQKRKRDGMPITMVTAYDYTSAYLADSAAVDVILVGDSLGMVVMGLESTVPVTMSEMLHHARIVGRTAKGALLVGDMPFLSFQTGPTDAIRNAGRFLKKAGMDAVKVEGGAPVIPTVRAIIGAGIPVMGHLGLTPQSVSMLGGFRVQGKTVDSAVQMVDDALALEDAGCFAVVLEAVPPPVAAVISERLAIPTIGIGAGPGCDGQVLVFHDMLGLFDRHTPRFVRQYAQIGPTILAALQSFREDVTTRRFPTEEHTYSMPAAELAAFLAAVEQPL